ncbi:MAG: uncharacterized protein K0Q51_196 [Rickettsiaceae bacterium]|jgi:uncharacterized SAM-binding protein YcdF (DUF218 family)|nr:uncharacterized protein [Rickettsiaceae bacterium]
MLKLVKILISLIIIWLAGLDWFISQIPFAPNTEFDIETDAVIALTGGVNRVDEAIKLLIEQRSKKLFISGVGSPIHLRDSLKQLDPNQNIILGTKAKSTYENAKEVSEWAQKHNLKSIRLVTANYHMPRASMLIKALSPGLVLIEHPVFPKAFNLREWYKSPLTVKLLLLEYNKYITLRFSLLFGVKIYS